LQELGLRIMGLEFRMDDRRALLRSEVRLFMSFILVLLQIPFKELHLKFMILELKLVLRELYFDLKLDFKRIFQSLFFF
jgi:hypothetical protein